MSPGSPPDYRLRFLNEVVYARMAPVYNAIDALTFGAWWSLVRRALDYVPSGGRVLEVGFGPGRLQMELAAPSEMSVGLDLAWGMCRYTQRRLRRSGLVPRIVRGDARQAPFRSGMYDAVVSTFALSGIPNGEVVVREMVRLIRRGGRVILLDIGLPTDGNILGRFWARLWERTGDRLYDQRALMADCGLAPVIFEEYGPGRHVRTVVGHKP